MMKNIDFIFRVVNINGYLLECIPLEIIISNYKLVVYAINTSGINVINFMIGNNYKNFYNFYDHIKENFYDHIKENIERYENFSVFLQGVCNPRSQSTLHKYDFFHSVYFLKSIANFTFTGNIISASDYNIYKSVFDKIKIIRKIRKMHIN